MTEHNPYYVYNYTNGLLDKQSYFTVFEYGLQAMPLFWVWLASLFVWFYLEVAAWEAETFNTKHSYVSQIGKSLTLNLHISLLLIKRGFKANILKTIYKLYI